MTLIEQVFRKMGYIRKDDGHKIFWSHPDLAYGENKLFLEPLPLIDSQWEVCAKYLVPFMRERLFDYDITNNPIPLKRFRWGDIEDGVVCWNTKWSAEIKDDNIAKAACEAFIEVSLD